MARVVLFLAVFGEIVLERATLAPRAVLRDQLVEAIRPLTSGLASKTR